MKVTGEGVQKLWARYKYVALVVLIGVVLLLWPSGNGDTDRDGVAAEVSAGETMEQLHQIEAQMQEILGHISGVGEVAVMLTAESDGQRELALDSELSYSGQTAAPDDYSRRSETVLTQTESGDAPVVTRTIYPTFRGALVVCQGGGQAEVRLAVTEAVAALTGLSSERITVAKWQ